MVLAQSAAQLTSVPNWTEQAVGLGLRSCSTVARWILFGGPFIAQAPEWLRILFDGLFITRAWIGHGFRLAVCSFLRPLGRRRVTFDGSSPSPQLESHVSDERIVPSGSLG